MKDIVGEQVDDMVIIEHLGYYGNKTTRRVIVKCAKCNRTKEISYWSFKNNEGTNHRACCKQVQPCESFHRKWYNMQTRITNENCKKYKDYGGRGIKCEWEYFIDFYDDMYESYLQHVEKYGKQNTTLERIDVNGNYCKENCTWATLEEQAKNKRCNVLFKAISPDGKIYYERDKQSFAKEHGLCEGSIRYHLKHPSNKTYKGWKFERMENE